ncbi:uroporphyrinogen-III synthase-like isoform X2 [Littorina saxatilis]|uniref:Uroporphyrinogen-III synthase n=1 Tax=Littorina saxatilis TaxID=31220 RepID=A0AAN9GJP5_9CAEN
MAKARDRKGTVLLLKAPTESEEDRFVEILENAGFRAILVPVLSFNYINQEQLTEALQHPEKFAGIIFTSPRAVKAVTMALEAVEGDSQQHDCCRLRCFVVGQATADAAKEVHFNPEGAETGNAERLSEFILNAVCRDEQKPLLYPSAKMRRDTLLERLQRGDCPVEEIVAYETIPGNTIMEDITQVFSHEEPPDSVVYFSPSGVQFTQAAVEEGTLPLKSLKVYALGPTTKEAILSRGYPLTGMATKPDPSSLLHVLQQGHDSM